MTSAPMNSPSLGNVVGISLWALANIGIMTGCAAGKSASSPLDAALIRAQTDTMVQDTQAELAALRRDLAAARIAMSKQEGEAAELRRKTALLESDRSELRKMLDQAHSALLTIQAEQDALKQTLTQAQTVGSVRVDPNPSTNSNNATLQSEMNELRGRLVKLAEEFSQLARQVPSKTGTISDRARRSHIDRVADPASAYGNQTATPQPRVLPSVAFLAPPEPEIRTGSLLVPSLMQEVIRIHPGDSLWKLAHDHATTIGELKRINGLATDVLQTGQRLIVPSSLPARINP